MPVIDHHHPIAIEREKLKKWQRNCNLLLVSFCSRSHNNYAVAAQRRERERKKNWFLFNYHEVITINLKDLDL